MKKFNNKKYSKPSVTQNHQICSNNTHNVSKNIIQPCTVVLNDIYKQNNKTPLISEDLGNGHKTKIFKCKSTRCGLKGQFVSRDKALSTCSKSVYDCITPPGTSYVDCYTSNVIYLLTCSTCGF